MNIHPFWFICLTVRLSIIILLWYLLKNNNKYTKIIKALSFIFIFAIGFGFIRKGYFSSNNEIQIRKVFWHEARYVHGVLYILASYYILKDNLNMCLLVLLLDLIFSILYRFTQNK